MKQEAISDVNKKLSQFTEISQIAEKLNSSEEYQTAFNEQLKAEARKAFDKGIAIDLDDYLKSHTEHIKGYSPSVALNAPVIENPTKEAEQDFATYQKILDTDFNITEKQNRSPQYHQAFSEQISSINQSQFDFGNIKKSAEIITDKSESENHFNEQYGKKFKPFIIDPIAKSDLEKYKAEDSDYLAFEISEKMKKADYAKSIELIYQEQGKTFMQGNNYAQNKIDNINERVNGLSDTQKAEFSEQFNKQYPNGFKTTAEQEAEKEMHAIEQARKLEKEANATYQQFQNELAEYLKTEQGNQTEQAKRVSYFQNEINNDPEKFNNFSEQFFTNGDFRSQLPKDTQAKLDRIGHALHNGKPNKDGAKKFSSALQSKVLDDTQKIANNIALGNNSVHAREQLKMYYARQFKKEYGNAEKKLQQKKTLNRRHSRDEKVKINY
ncbi:hypothetical protein A1D22_09170 [Pasteurellaceae bacterium LFhippo2]|nr:hypothetical protein [Pasteurellaceae bacterium LFhippo2]